jgi:hypothetical protein
MAGRVDHFTVFAVFDIRNWCATWSAKAGACSTRSAPIDLVFTIDSSGNITSTDPHPHRWLRLVQPQSHHDGLRGRSHLHHRSRGGSARAAGARSGWDPVRLPSAMNREVCATRNYRGVMCVMSEFSTVTKRNGNAFLTAFVARKDEALARWFSALEAAGGPSHAVLDRTPASMVPLWAWLRPRLTLIAKTDVDVTTAPMWCEPLLVNSKHGGIGFSPETLWWMDGLIYYWSEILRAAFAGARWAIDTDPKSFFYPHPLLLGAHGMLEAPVFKATRMVAAAAQGDTVAHDRRWLEIFQAIEEDQTKKATK